MRIRLKIHIKLIVIISSLISIALVLFIAINANKYMERMSENNSELYRAYRISEVMKSFRNNITVLDSKQQGYLVTGDGKFLEAFKIKETETKTYLKSMEKYFSGTAEEETFYRLKDLTYRKLRAAKDLSGMNAGTPAAGNENIQEAGAKTMEQINTTTDEINSSLAGTTQQLLDKSVEYVNVSRKWNLLEIAIAILTALTALVILFRDINIRSNLEKELRKAKEAADNNAAAKAQFLANMSHEIRTPMNAIIGFSDLLEKTALDNTQEEYLAAIRNSGSNLLNIINDILDFSKIGAGKLQIEKIAFDMKGLLTSLHVMFAEKAAAKKINFSVSVDPATPQYVFGDPTRLMQILVNLVNNAVKFTEKGGVSLSCGIRSIEHDVAQFVFRIRDTGIGIPAEKQDGIFGRFSQANTETTRKYGGTGLGLAIVKELVEIQNGTIQLRSTELEGSEFIVTISYPVSYEDALSEAKDPKVSLSLGTERPLRVLLAEDNVLNQKLATAYLEGFGATVDIAENGQAALDKLQQARYDLLLLDIQMPVLDGYSTALRLRQELKLDIPVIAMTAHIMADEKEKCLRYGMTDYISKPFKETDLFNIIKKNMTGVTAGTAVPLKPEVPSAGAENAIVNVKELFGLARGNMNFVKEMIGIFLRQNAKDLAEIRSGIAVPDFEQVRATAHRMRTSAGFMGIGAMLDTLEKIEKEAKSGQDMQVISTQYGLLDRQSEKAVQELNMILSTIDQS